MPDLLSDAFDSEKDDFEDVEEQKVLEDLTDEEEIQAAKEIIKEELGEPGKDTSTNSDKKNEAANEPEKDTSESSKEGKENPEDKGEGKSKEEEDVNPENKPQEKGHAEQPVLNEQILNELPEDLRGALKKYEGKSLLDIAKALGNAQKLIGKKQTKVEELLSTKQKEFPPLPKDDEKITEQIDEAVLNELRHKYPDVPSIKDKDEYLDYIRDLQDEDPEKFVRFITDKENIRQSVEADMKRSFYIAENYTAINEERLNSEIEAIKDGLKVWGIEKPEEAGFDFSLQKDEEGRFINPLLNRLMVDESGGGADPSVIQYFADKPILTEGGLSRKFFDVMKTEIATAVRNQAASEAAKNYARQKEEAPNTLSSHKSSGTPTKEITLEDLERTTDDALLQSEKEKIFNSL